jgi:hypothetical protein
MLFIRESIKNKSKEIFKQNGQIDQKKEKSQKNFQKMIIFTSVFQFITQSPELIFSIYFASKLANKNVYIPYSNISNVLDFESLSLLIKNVSNIIYFLGYSLIFFQFYFFNKKFRYSFRQLFGRRKINTGKSIEN